MCGQWNRTIAGIDKIKIASQSCIVANARGRLESLPADVHVLIIVNGYSDCSEKSIPRMSTSSSNSKHEHGCCPQNWQADDVFPDIRL